MRLFSKIDPYPVLSLSDAGTSQALPMIVTAMASRMSATSLDRLSTSSATPDLDDDVPVLSCGPRCSKQDSSEVAGLCERHQVQIWVILLLSR